MYKKEYQWFASDKSSSSKNSKRVKNLKVENIVAVDKHYLPELFFFSTSLFTLNKQ